MKWEHQRTGGVTQRISIPEWKLERITTDFMVGFPRTLCMFYSTWIIVDGLTKSAYFVTVETTYN